eukprot:6119917-Amphidinium_carterae.2
MWRMGEDHARCAWYRMCSEDMLHTTLNRQKNHVNMLLEQQVAHCKQLPSVAMVSLSSCL